MSFDEQAQHFASLIRRAATTDEIGAAVDFAIEAVGLSNRYHNLSYDEAHAELVTTGEHVGEALIFRAASDRWDEITNPDHIGQYSEESAIPETDPENVYGSPSMRQSIEEDRR